MSESSVWIIYISLFIIFLLILIVAILEIISGLKLQNIKQQAEPIANDLQKLGVAAQDLKNELSKMGIRTEDTHDTLTIHGGSPHGAEIDTYNDHRIAMAFAVAGMYLPGIVIRHPEVVNKTFPNFWEVLRSLK